MVAVDSPSPRGTPDPVLASVDRHRADIAEQCLRTLQHAGSPLARDPVTRDQVRTQVHRVLDDTVALVRGGEDARAAARPDPVSIDIGAHRARHGIHPAESVYAADVLFETAVRAVAPDLAEVARPTDAVTQFCLALQRSLTRRVGVAARAYFTALLDRIREVHAEERLRVSRELHDQAAQTVVVALHELELHETYRVADHARAQAKLVAARTHLQQAIDTIRALSAQLRQSEAGEGLQPALVRCMSAAPPSVATSVSVTGNEWELPPALRDDLFLVLREAVTNALRHADPPTVTVHIRITARRVDATVIDDGRGYDVERMLVAPTGSGLPSMVERAHAAGGTLEIGSSHGHGTTVRVRLPLPRRPG